MATMHVQQVTFSSVSFRVDDESLYNIIAYSYCVGTWGHPRCCLDTRFEMSAVAARGLFSTLGLSDHLIE
ncbi:hypothetical protein Taro_010937 [Colocasia esculenta]|uniref:Uncharacterized protein n=1 Tax=Colocasia esculenta TaxID=4460 RepID=A0A843U4I5_COLES|nr:hypothetical protein [Colocasia esculenta]